MAFDQFLLILIAGHTVRVIVRVAPTVELTSLIFRVFP